MTGAQNDGQTIWAPADHVGAGDDPCTASHKRPKSQKVDSKTAGRGYILLQYHPHAWELNQ
jgi:hypothetical protein